MKKALTPALRILAASLVVAILGSPHAHASSTQKTCARILQIACLSGSLLGCQSPGRTDRANLDPAIVTSSDQAMFAQKLKAEGIEINRPIHVEFLPWWHGSQLHLDLPTYQMLTEAEDPHLIDITVQANFKLLQRLKELRVQTLFFEALPDTMSLTRDQLHSLTTLLTDSRTPATLREHFVQEYGFALMYYGRVAKAFENGIVPDRWEDLTDDQKLVLYQFGAPPLALLLGYVGEIRGATSPERLEVVTMTAEIVHGDASNKRLWPDQLSPELAKIVFEERETDALVLIARYAETQPDLRKVLLVYGASHLFEDYSLPGKLTIVRDPMLQQQIQSLARERREVINQQSPSRSQASTTIGGHTVPSSIELSRHYLKSF